MDSATSWSADGNPRRINMTNQAESPLKRLLFLQAVTFLHPGTGQSTGVVDLPVQREVHTGFPLYSASGLKGALRDKAETGKWDEDGDEVKLLFGSESGGAGQTSTAGALSLTDARILAFPVRSLQRVFLWVTCPMVIERLRRDSQLLALDGEIESVGEGLAEGTALVHTRAGIEEALVLEEVSLIPDARESVDRLSAQIACLAGSKGGFEAERLVIVTDEDFKYFVQYATQVSARIKLNERKTTTGDRGNLWYEETLPPETLLYALVLCHRARTGDEVNGSGESSKGSAAWVAKKLGELLEDNFLQIGGNETVGQGWCRITCREAVPVAEEACDDQ
jgi:CRISPR-associated protein Cmr4